MKKIRCPKCDTAIAFDEKRYEPGRILVFECPDCKKVFKARVNAPTPPPLTAETQVYGTLSVVENLFHLPQEIPLTLGVHILGRHVKGTAINTPITTNDPSMDTTHCQIVVKKLKSGKVVFALSDCQSVTGTFLMNKVLAPKEQIYLTDGSIITLGATTLIFQTSHEDPSLTPPSPSV